MSSEEVVVAPEVVVALVQLLSVTAIGVYTTWIARQQLRINKYRVKLDLYDRRWAVYESFGRYVGIATTHPLNSMTHDTLAEFARTTRQAEFLFDADIKQYRNAMIQHGTNLQALQEMSREFPQGLHDRSKAIAERSEELEWFAAQPDAMVEKFAPYLRLKRL